MGLNETKLTKKIENFWTKNGSYIVKQHGNNFTAQGTPDLIICYKGFFVAIEVKFGNNKPSKIQEEHIKRIEKWYDGFAFWVNENDWEEKCNQTLSDLDFYSKGLESIKEELMEEKWIEEVIKC